jgi:hypothetical protein
MRTPDSFPGDLREDVIALYDQYGIMPENPGEMVYSDGYFYAQDAYGVFNVRSGQAAGYLDEEAHERLDTLVHEIDETSYDEATYSGSDISAYTVWTSATKTRKVREELYTYDVGHRVSQVVTRQYDADGNVKMTMTEVYTYTGVSKLASVTRTKN